jgi:hypothetical protein
MRQGWRGLSVAVAALVVAGAFGLVGHASAALPPECSQSGRIVTCTYLSGSNPFEVPARVRSIHVVAVAGAGGSNSGPGSFGVGGRAARVEADLKVAPLQTLHATVGGNANGAVPGANGGGQGDVLTLSGGSTLGSGGGGGASDLRITPDDMSSRLVVAGGGGGAGAGALPVDDTGVPFPSGGGTPGGDGGDGGGGDGLDGEDTICVIPDTDPPDFSGNLAGAGGAGGSIPSGFGEDGEAASGQFLGSGCLPNIVGGPGGGGGAGLFGGAGGAAATWAPAGGGGGGSNLVPPRGSASLDTTGTPLVQISYRQHGRP